MSKNNITNYCQELNQYFQVFGTMLDVGCRGLNYLFQFDNSKFKRLIGIDIKLPNDAFQKYFIFKNLDLPDLKFEYDFLEKRFFQKYKLFEKNILEFHIKKNYYGFIFCKHVIHFIPHDLQLQLIENLYNGLKYQGIIFLKVNHFQNLNYRDSLNVKRIAEETFLDERKKTIHYPIEPDKFIQYLKIKYSPESITKDDKSITAIIRKIKTTNELL